MKQKNNIDKLVKDYKPPFEKSKDDAWKELDARLQDTPRKRTLNRWIAVAAVVAVLSVLSFLADSILFIDTYSTDYFAQQTIVLSDESEVLLNPNSEIKVNYSFFSGKRNLKLKGEALFDVEEGEPFSVDFGEGKVTVLGTRFRIKSYSEIDPVVNCLAGSVRVKTKNDMKTLEPGGGVIVTSADVLEQVEIDPEKVLEEMNGIYNFQDELLLEVFNLLEMWSGYKVKTPENTGHRKFKGLLRLDDLENTCETLAFAMSLSYSIDHEQKTVTFERKD